MNKKNEIAKTQPKETDAAMRQLITNIETAVVAAHNKLATAINSVMTNVYWQIGKYIVEYEQNGQAKVKYGDSALSELSKQLTLRLGRGYSRPNLHNMRKFYIRYPNCQTVSDNLSWSHICLLLQADDELERSFYEKETIANKWNVRTLKRQMESALYLRLAASKDKTGILNLALQNTETQTPDEVVKDSYTLEFLNIPENYQYSETELEQKIIDNLQMFMLELGKGFTFEKRQYPITVNNRHYHCDLVFYHRFCADVILNVNFRNYP